MSCKSGFLEKIRISVPGASKLDHSQQVEPILFRNFSKFFIFILEGQFLLPQSANCEKREFSQLSNWMRRGSFSGWGIQIGPNASFLSKKFPNIFNSRDLYTGGSLFLLPQDGEKGRCKRVVSHPSTNRAKHCLTSVVERALVLPSWHCLCQDTKWKTGKEEMQSWVSQLRFLEAKSGIQYPGHPN